MSTISAGAVKALRDRTNAPMMDCKAALAEAGGDMEKAFEILRKRSKDIQDKKGARETAEGRVAAFIDPAKQESVDTILEMAEYKKTGNAKKLIVADCLVERYGADIRKEVPEVDAWVATTGLRPTGSSVSE